MRQPSVDSATVHRRLAAFLRRMRCRCGARAQNRHQQEPAEPEFQLRSSGTSIQWDRTLRNARRGAATRAPQSGRPPLPAFGVRSAVRRDATRERDASRAAAPRDERGATRAAANPRRERGTAATASSIGARAEPPRFEDSATRPARVRGARQATVIALRNVQVGERVEIVVDTRADQHPGPWR